MKFTELKLSDKVLKGLTSNGFIEATDIQEKAIPHLMKGKCLIGQAKTGSGKTLAFGIPIIENIDENKNLIQAAIISPTRELAKQISDELTMISKYTRIKILSIYGGVSFDNQMEQLKRGVHIIVSTPGRLLDHFRHGLRTKPKIIVLDEADKMFDMGFYEDVNQILRYMKWQKGQQQFMFFGATIPDETIRLSKKYAPHAITISVRRKNEEQVPSSINQIYYIIENSNDKINLLTRILDEISNNGSKVKNLKILIFVKTRVETRKLCDELRSLGYSAEYICSDLSQRQRERTLNNFKNKGRFLIATDVVSRGIDIEGITHVINFDMPDSIETYVHRIGRTGRMGKKGTAISFVFYEDEYLMSQIEKKYKVNIKKKYLQKQIRPFYF
ncbi:MAG: DEAD/DEAH box helicase [Candidatus Helarchaeota archaeon]